MSRKPAAKNGRTGWRFCAVLLCAVLTVPLVPFESFAQEQRRTLFEMLFGRPVGRDGGSGREYQPRTRRDFPSAPRERSVTRPQPARKAPSVVQMRTAKPEPAAKLENARRVLVIGDFLAGGMGEELVNAFASSPAIAVDVRANGSSGLVRTDYYDWFTNLPQFISETKPATIVIMMGSNDRQQMQIGDISTHAISPYVYKNLTYDPIKDFKPVIQITSVSLLLVVNPQLKANSVAELIALAKENGYTVTERHMKPEELADFDECFLTGTAAEVTPVSEVGEYRFTPGDACRTLIDAYSRAVQPKRAAAE